MPLTSDELAYVHSWVGDLETDVQLSSRFDRLVSTYDERDQAVDAAIEESIRHRLAVLTLDQPGQMAIAGISIGWGNNITAIQQQLTKFMNTKGSGVMGTAQMEREDFVR